MRIENRGTFVQSVLDIGNIFARGVSGKDSSLLLTYSAAPSPAFGGGVKKRRFLRLALDTEFIEVQGQP